ncbi:MAG TPA: tetratricopeptide repeat protein [Candidatus Krumholzibacteria bacterium]|nr:tetratricopeptide repeat protein [Candidatus Krumholzibacteria bacterium]
MKRINFLAIVLVAGAAGGAIAGSTPTPTTSLAELGMTFEKARTLAPVERGETMADLDQRLGAMIGDLDHDQKAAGYFLWGEIRFASGRYDDAAQAFRSAAKEAKDSPLAADASLAVIQSQEAAGHDTDVEKQWSDWFKDNGKANVAAEAMLARSWSAISHDSLGLADRTLKAAGKQYAWITRDPRYDLATSTTAYLEGRYADVHVKPSGSPLDAACVYLQALTDEAMKRPLQAAAHYQDVVDRYNDPHLRDVAMLAKANVFLKNASYKSAAEEFATVATRAQDPGVVAEAKLRGAACIYLAGNTADGIDALRAVTSAYDGNAVAARAQAVLGEVLFQSGQYENAIVEFNKVLTKYFQHSLASLAQYRVGRCLDALDRGNEATSAYQAVVSGYPTSREAPPAAYLAGVGLMTQNKPMAAVPYFRLVLDRYAQDKGTGTIEFATPERQELVEASLCLLELSYHDAGQLGLLSGVPHLMLQRMPSSKSPWRANALLIDADALAAQGRHSEAQTMLQQLIAEFGGDAIGVPAYRLLAWSYSQQGKLDLAVETQDKMLARYGASGHTEDMSTAYLNKGHILFNEKNYKEAARTYEAFLTDFPNHPERQLALYQAGMCYQRMGQTGDAVDRWDEVTSIDPTSAVAEKAWTRAGDVYFTTAHYDKARDCYQGLLSNFGDTSGAAVALLRLAQCDYNTGRYSDAVESYSQVISRFPNHAVVGDAKKGIEQALYQLGQGKDGDAMLAQLVEKYPTSSFAAQAQFEIALRRYQAGDYDAAAEAFRRVVSQFPSYSDADRAHYLMADSYSRAGKNDEARAAYEQFVSFFPNSEYRDPVRLQLGASRFADGNYMQAATDFTAVLSDSTAPEVKSAAQYNLALCQRMLGAPDKAVELLEAYRTEHPNDERTAEVAHQLGIIHEEAGQFHDAAVEYNRAMQQKLPGATLVEIRYRLGLCREKQGDDKGAIAAYALAADYSNKADTYRLSAIARSAALHEKHKNYAQALAAYRDLIKNATDPEIVVAAKERATELQSAAKQ